MRLKVLMVVLQLALHAPCAASTDSTGRGNQELLFYMENEEYLLPFIEQTLTGLTFAGSADSLFREVLNLNAYEDNIRYQRTTRTIISTYGIKDTVRTHSREAMEAYDDIAQGFLKYDLFLKVKVHALNELLEFQFILYEMIPTEYPASQVPVPDVQRSVRARSVFVDPRQPDYLSDLENTIKQIFPSSNQPPIPVVKVNGKTNEGSTVHRFAVGDSIVLDASESVDRDSPRSSFIYEWRQIDPQGDVNVPIDELISLDQHTIVQTLKFDTVGYYKFGVRVSDGISVSHEDTIDVVIVERPRLRLHRQELFHLSQPSFFATIRDGYTKPVFRRDELGMELVGSLGSGTVFQIRSFDSTLISAADIDQPEWDPSKQRSSAQIAVVPRHGSDQSGDTTWSGRPRQTLYSRRSDLYQYSFVCHPKDSGYTINLKGVLPDGKYRLVINALQGEVVSHPAVLHITTRCRSGLQWGHRTGYFSVTTPDSADSEEWMDEDGAMWALFARAHLWKGFAIEVSRFYSYHTGTDWRLGGKRWMGKLQYTLRSGPRFQMMMSLNFLRHGAFAWSESSGVMSGLGYDLELKVFRHLSIEFGYHIFTAPLGTQNIGGNLITVGLNLDIFGDSRASDTHQQQRTIEEHGF